MTMDPHANSPFPGLSFAGEWDDLSELKMEIAMTEDWQGYLNRLVLVKQNELFPGRLNYVRFLPVPEAGEVIVVPADDPEEYGATEVKYTETETGAWVNLRLALKRLRVNKLQGRVRIFKVVERTAPNGKVYLAFVVKNSTTRPARKLKLPAHPTAGPADPPSAETAATVQDPPGAQDCGSE